MNTKKYDFYADQSHGWLKVKREELAKLGILKDISGYSYQKNGYVYLEEDCDASLFIKTMEKWNTKVVCRGHYSNRESKIRNYQNFSV